jgi:ABC-type sugar transport system permease subunit
VTRVADARDRRRRERWTAAVCVVPLLAVFALFYLWPAANTVGGSLYEWDVFGPWNLINPVNSHYVGFDNYTTLFGSKDFWTAVLNTAVWLILFPLLVTVFSLFVAILLWQIKRAATVYRVLFVLPMTLSLTAIGVIWKLVYNPDYGTLDGLIRGVHAMFTLDLGPLHAHDSQWLSTPGYLDLGFARLSLVNISLIIPAFWAFTGFGVITFAAGLTSVPTELIDAAKVDGASWWQSVRHVLIPMLRRPMLIVIVVSVIFALRTFDIVYVMTGGGPGTDSQVLAVLLYKQAFAFLDTQSAGQATAIAVLMSLVMVLAAYPYLRSVLRGNR